MLKPFLAVAALLASLTTAPQALAVTWGAPTEVAPRAGLSGIDEPRVALTSAGHAVFAWYRWGDTGDGAVEGRSATMASLSQVTRLGQTSRLPYTGPFEKVQVAMSPGSGGVIAWIDFDRASRELSGRAVVARLVSADGAVGEPIVVSAPGAAPRDLQAVVDGAGNAVIAWTDGDGDRVRARRLKRDGSLGALVPVAESGGVVRLVGDASGNAIVGWWRQDAETVAIRVLRFDGTVGPARSLGRVEVARFSLALDSLSGTGAVAFAQRRGGRDRLYARRISTAGVLGERRAVATQEVESPVVAVDGRGRALIAWSGVRDRRRQGLWLRPMRRSGAFGRMRLVRRASDPLYPDIAVNGRGRGAISFYDYDSSVSVVPITTAGTTGKRRRFRGAKTGENRRTALAMNADGTAIVTWLGSAGHTVVAVRGRL